MLPLASALVLSLALSAGPVDPSPQAPRVIGLAKSAPCVREILQDAHPGQFYTVLVRSAVENADGTWTVEIAWCPRCWLEEPVLCALICNVTIYAIVDPETGDVLCRVLSTS